MQTSFKTTVILTLMALIFTIGLTFTAVELPGLADSFVQKNVGTPDLATGQDEENGQKTQIYLKHYHLRALGYLALFGTILLIVIGLLCNRTGMASAGALLLFLPVFGHFAATMFFLGGLAMLRLLWLPFLDLSFDIMRLGEIVLIPYRAILQFFSLLNLNLEKYLPYILTGIGFFIFILGTMSWFHARIRKQKVADFWIYKMSRHPQYLGWIIWSYGIMFLPGVNMRRSFYISDTLPWLLSTMVIIGVALFEELRMKKSGAEEYEKYQLKTPFLFPLPKWSVRLLKAPHRLFFKKNHFERKKEILVFLFFYTCLSLILSGFYSDLITLGKSGSMLSVREMEEIAQRIGRTDNRMAIRAGLLKLARSGEAAIPPLLSLTASENPIVRWYTVDVLGDFHSPKVLQVLIRLLDDPNSWVRKAAAGSLGKLQDRNAVLPLIEAFRDPGREIEVAAAQALGNIKDRRALKPLTDALFDSTSHIAGAAAEALGNLGKRESIPALIRCLETRQDCPFNQIGFALHKLGSDRAIDAFSRALSDNQWWTRIGALQQLADMQNPDALHLIINALKDPEAKVRRAAVWVLKKIGSVRALEPLRKMHDDPDLEVRIYARETIQILQKSEKCKD